MSRTTIPLTAELYAYYHSIAVRDRDVLRRLREETAALPNAQMQISPEQGELLAFLVRLIGARRTLEVGVFTGYSSLSVALALPEDGRIVACDVSEEWTAIARRYWTEAKVAHKVDLRLGPAADTLASLLQAGEGGSYDFAFIDADKASYDTYYERSLALVRPGGLIAIDNVFRDGDVADPNEDDEGVRAIRALNQKIHSDERVDHSILPISDGMTLVRKR